MVGKYSNQNCRRVPVKVLPILVAMYEPLNKAVSGIIFKCWPIFPELRLHQVPQRSTKEEPLRTAGARLLQAGCPSGHATNSVKAVMKCFGKSRGNQLTKADLEKHPLKQFVCLCVCLWHLYGLERIPRRPLEKLLVHNFYVQYACCS